MPERPPTDPQVFWSWVGGAIRPVAGWVLAAAGVLALVLGYLGTSREAIVAKQLPYLISGGLTGVALLFLGGALIGTQDVRRYGQRIEHLEQLVAELHTTLVEPDEDPPAGDPIVELPAATAKDNGAPTRGATRKRAGSRA